MSVRRSKSRAGLRHVCAMAVATMLTVSAIPLSTAGGIERSVQDLSTGSDFRVRAAAALTLGRSHNKGALAPLRAALDDQHPAVRSAAAAALAALGDKSAIDDLRSHATREP